MATLDYMKDYADVIMRGGDMIGGAIDANRQRRDMLAQQQLQNQFGQQKYSDALMQDQRDYQLKLSEDKQAQANSDRSYTQGLTTADIKEYQFAKQNGFEGKFQDWLTQKAGASGDGKYFGTPLPYQKSDGSTGYGLPNRAGGFAELPSPAGSTFMGPFDRAAATTAGKATGTAQTSLPSIENSASRITGTVDAALNDPDLSGVTGYIQGRLPARTGGQARAQSRIDEIQGGAFLSAYNDLRGGGQITEVEGQKATDALNRLRTQTMSDEDYRAALQDFKVQVQNLVEIARQRAAGSGVRPTMPGQPQQAQPQQPAGGGWSVQQVQ